MQQFITDSPWDHAEVMEQVATEAAGPLGGHRDTALYLDETSFAKKGNASVGMHRQYCGRLGKLENCKVASSPAWDGRAQGAGRFPAVSAGSVGE